jgi:hypothetical protein
MSLMRLAQEQRLSCLLSGFLPMCGEVPSQAVFQLLYLEFFKHAWYSLADVNYGVSAGADVARLFK